MLHNVLHIVHRLSTCYIGRKDPMWAACFMYMWCVRGNREVFRWLGGRWWLCGWWVVVVDWTPRFGAEDRPTGNGRNREDILRLSVVWWRLGVGRRLENGSMCHRLEKS